MCYIIVFLKMKILVIREILIKVGNIIKDMQNLSNPEISIVDILLNDL